MEGRNKYLLTYILWFVDLAIVVLSFIIATYIRFLNFRDMEDKTLHFIVFIVFALMSTIYTFALDYNRDYIRRTFWQEGTAVFKYVVAMTVSTMVIIYAINIAGTFSRLVMGYFGIIDFILTYLAHILLKKMMSSYWSNSDTAAKILVISEEEIMMPTIRHLQHRLEINFRIVGAACIDKDMTGEVIRGVKILSNAEKLIETVTTMPFDEVFIYTPNKTQNELSDMIQAFSDMGVTVHYCVELADIPGSSHMGEFGTYSVISYVHGTGRYRALILKRVMDIVGGLVGLILTGIITPFVALAIRIDSPGPIFFSQTRIGKNGRRFKIYKFRSMYQDAEERKKELEKQNEMSGLMFKIKDDPRITKVGAFIRKTSIDELPQFWNVFKGDMSLVGTRPPTEGEFEQYTQYYRRRISMTPGLTGMWQVSGRSNIEDFEEIVKLDLRYIDNWSIGLDIRIIIKTVGVVLFGRGAS